jgi:hypothetical protein
MTPESHDEEYYYNMLLLHLPWRQEPHDLLQPDFEIYHDAYVHHKEWILAVRNEGYAQRLEAEVARIFLMEQANEELRAYRAAEAAEEGGGACWWSIR